MPAMGDVLSNVPSHRQSTVSTKGPRPCQIAPGTRTCAGSFPSRRQTCEHRRLSRPRATPESTRTRGPSSRIMRRCRGGRFQIRPRRVRCGVSRSTKGDEGHRRPARQAPPTLGVRVAITTFLGTPAPNVTEAALINPRTLVVLEAPPVRIDVLTNIDGITSFASTWKRAEGHYGDVPIHFISREDLVTAKRASAQPQDLVDVDVLLEAAPARRCPKKRWCSQGASQRFESTSLRHEAQFDRRPQERLPCANPLGVASPRIWARAAKCFCGLASGCAGGFGAHPDVMVGRALPCSARARRRSRRDRDEIAKRGTSVVRCARDGSSSEGERDRLGRYRLRARRRIRCASEASMRPRNLECPPPLRTSVLE